ncbi:MAG: quinolinate synthase NadA [Rhodospirillaceae bacterium]|nr:quinolinate synthase NadA [Rhodospirillaceae bacterium]
MKTVVLPGPDDLNEDKIDPMIDLSVEIDLLRRKRNAMILAHYYQSEEIQDLADFVGDSFDLSRRAMVADAEVIVFCGVRFMGEVAKIVNPSKTVLIPDADASCSLEESCRPEAFRLFRKKHPDHFAVTYINCSAEVKSISDVIVTSSNAEMILKQLPMNRPILFAPDRHLGNYLIKKSGRDITLWPGSCIVHEQFSERELVKLRIRHERALIVAHPECSEGILKYADHIGSTKSILDYVLASKAHEFIIATEPHIIHQMRKMAPNKVFIIALGMNGSCDCAKCPFMEKNTLSKIYLCLLNNAPRIELSEDLLQDALKPLQCMFDMSVNTNVSSNKS